jgi:PTH1 family peptidyl-tRNA hydrolase
LIVGLGNPGAKYARTRHNAGSDALELLAEKLGARIAKLRGKALTGEAFYGSEKLILALPQTFMNLSGESVRELMRFYDLGAEKLIVLYDDIDLAAGRLRVRPKGSAGSHNGMKSILYSIGSEEFPRVRIGIGHKPDERMDLKDYVLGHYGKDEQEAMFQAFLRAGEAALTIVSAGVEEAMAKFNGKG